MTDNMKKFKKGEVIFAEGAFEMWMYDLIEGKVGIYTNYGKPEERLLTEIAGGENTFFGEMGLIDAMPRSATAVALENTCVKAVSGENFGEYFKNRHMDVLLIMQGMSKRIRALTQDYLDACRAVSEVVENEGTGKEKSSWFNAHVKQFLKDFAEGFNAASQYPRYKI